MNACRLLISAALALALASAARAVDREVKRVFPVQPGCTLIVESYRGNITVEESDAAEVRVSVQLDFDVDTEAEADRLRADLQLEFKAEGDTVAVTARNPSEKGFRFAWREKIRMDLSYRISVPGQCNLALKTLNGSITVGKLAGRMSAQVENGNIFFRQIEGSVEATTQFGDVIVSRCSGAVTARVLRGVIRTGTIGGPANLKNSNGGIEVMMAKGALTVFAEVGDVWVNFPREISQPARVTASGGNVFAKIDPAANCDVDASAIWGRLECTLPLRSDAGGSSKRRVVGPLNRGGPLLTLHANGGSVKIEAGEMLFE